MSPVLVIEVVKGAVVLGCRGKLEQMYASLVPGKKNAACIICESFYVYYRFPLLPQFRCTVSGWARCRSGVGLCRQSSRHKPHWEGYRLDGAFFSLEVTTLFCSACV